MNSDGASCDSRSYAEGIEPCVDAIVELGSTAPPVVLHRLAAVRRQKRIPRRVLAERLGITVEELRLAEQSADLSIGAICRWAEALNVPVTELIVEFDASFTPPRLALPQATRLMQVAGRLLRRTRRRSVQRLTQTFVEQLSEILPALERVAQNNRGRVRRPNRPPRPGPLRPLPENVFGHRLEPEFRRPASQ